MPGIARAARTLAAAARLTALAALLSAGCGKLPLEPQPWTDAEVRTLRSLWLGSLGAPPADPTNRWAEDPRAADLGHRLFFDPRLSRDGNISCASCHQPELDFQDGLPVGVGVGTTDRRTMPIAAASHSPWQFWDGRSDSQWAQALGPLENPVEHGGTRALVAHVIGAHYAAEYSELFGPLPDLRDLPAHAGPVADAAARAAWDALEAARQAEVTRVFVNVGKAIAAYERRIEHGSSRFDRYVEALLAGRSGAEILSADEVAGLRLFIGRAACIECHNGPLLTNHDFHNTGIPAHGGAGVDAGRAEGARQVLDDDFNCRGAYSDAPDRCPELDFIIADGPALVRAFRVPGLRGVAERAPYMHAGQLPNLGAVLQHYDAAPAAPAGTSQLRPLGLTPRERAQLEAYLRTLSAPLSAEPRFLAPPRT
jgi:cytochrome c peroxidase